MIASHILSRSVFSAFVRSLLVLTALFGISRPVFAEDASSAPERLPGYYVSIDADGAFWSLRINGVSVWRDFDGEQMSIGLPITPYLREGTNTIDVTFVSVMGDPYEYNVANPGFYFTAALERSAGIGTSGEKVTLLNIALDPATNRPIVEGKTPWGFDTVRRDVPPMVLSAHQFDEAPLVSGWGPQNAWTGRRATVSFQIDDPLPAPPWADAPVMEDTPEIRAKLLDAYRVLHAALESEDRTQIRAFYEPAWKHTAAVMNYASVEQFIEKARAFESLARQPADGGVLQPLDLVRGPADFDVEFMDGGRLARIVPDPIVWANGDDAPFPTTTTNVAFFQHSDGSWKVGMVVF